MNRAAALLLAAGVIIGAVATPIVLRLPRSGTTAQQGKSRDYRWLDITITLPSDVAEQFHVGRIPAPRADRPFELVVLKIDDDKAGELRIDARTGDVLTDTLTDTDPGVVQAVLASLRFDYSTPTVWPYADSPVPAETLRWGRIEVTVPDPASGIEIYPESGFCDPSAKCSAQAVGALDGRVRMGVGADTGEILLLEQIDASPAPEPARSAFLRWAASAKILPEETPAPATPSTTPSPG